MNFSRANSHFFEKIGLDDSANSDIAVDALYEHSPSAHALKDHAVFLHNSARSLVFNHKFALDALKCKVVESEFYDPADYLGGNSLSVIIRIQNVAYLSSVIGKKEPCKAASADHLAGILAYYRPIEKVAALISVLQICKIVEGVFLVGMRRPGEKLGYALLLGVFVHIIGVIHRNFAQQKPLCFKRRYIGKYLVYGLFFHIDLHSAACGVANSNI